MNVLKNRADLEYYFDSVLTNNHQNYKRTSKNGYGRNAIKTYIIESHETVDSNDFSAIISRAKEINNQTKLRETEEASLIYLGTSDLDFYVDINDKRFIIFHTSSPSKLTDPFIKKFTNVKGYDNIWLPVSMLLQTIEFGKFWGLGVSYRESIDELESIESWEPSDIQDVSLSVQRHFAKTFFDILMDSKLKHMMGVSKLSVLRTNENPKEENDFIIDDIKYNGKVTAKGTSFSKHSRIIFDLINLYHSAINKLETFGLSFDSGLLSGSPITITFSRKILPRRLLNVMFNAEEPFRLWGVEEEVNDNFIRVYAVDLHHGNPGNKLTFELTPDFLRVSMPKNSCSNTILRLFANINHYVDAMARLEVDDFVLKVDLSRT